MRRKIKYLTLETTIAKQEKSVFDAKKTNNGYYNPNELRIFTF